MTSLAEYFQAFHSYAYENALTASARTLYYTILGEFNSAYWKRSELSKSVRELREIGGFKSESIVQRAKALLGTENILQITKNKNCDVYKLVEPSEWRNAKKSIGTLEEHLRNTSGTPEEHLRNTSRVSNYACAKDKEDIKDSKTEFNNNNPPARKKNLDSKPISVNSDAVNQAWFDCEGEHLRGGKALKLIELEKKFGTQAVVNAIMQAHCANNQPCLNVNFVAAILENPQKGDGKRGKIVRLNQLGGSSAKFNPYGIDPSQQEFPPD